MSYKESIQIYNTGREGYTKIRDANRGNRTKMIVTYDETYREKERGMTDFERAELFHKKNLDGELTELVQSEFVIQ